MKIRMTIIILIAIICFILGFLIAKATIIVDESQAYSAGWNDCKTHYNIEKKE